MATGPDRLASAAQRRGVRDPRLLDAIRTVPRADFVPPEWAGAAHRDAPVPIPHDQVTTQPSLSAQMIEALSLADDEHVLEVGTGYGYQTALLARIAGFVHSIERFEDLAAVARANLDRHGIDNVAIVIGDGSEGLPAEAPFDAVLVSAAFPEVPRPLTEQLRDGGRVTQPIGRGGDELVRLFVKDGGMLVPQRTITGARFVRLAGKYGFPK